MTLSTETLWSPPSCLGSLKHELWLKYKRARERTGAKNESEIGKMIEADTESERRMSVSWNLSCGRVRLEETGEKLRNSNNQQQMDQFLHRRTFVKIQHINIPPGLNRPVNRTRKSLFTPGLWLTLIFSTLPKKTNQPQPRLL